MAFKGDIHRRKLIWMIDKIWDNYLVADDGTLLDIDNIEMIGKATSEEVSEMQKRAMMPPPKILRVDK